MAAARIAAVLSLRLQRRTRAERGVLRRQPAVRRLQRRGPTARPDLPGGSRRIGRLPHRGSVREDAFERHPVAARRRPSADCEPAAHVGRHPRVPRARRMTRGWPALLIAVTIGTGSSSEVAVPAPEPRMASTQGQPEDGRPVRVGMLKPGGGYAFTTLPMETYVPRVLAG